MKHAYQFGGLSDAPQVSTTRKTTQTIYTFQTKEVKVATVRDAPTNLERIDAPELCEQFWRETVSSSPWFDPRKEAMVTLLLNTRYHMEGFTLISLGTINESIAHPREVFRPAIVASCYAIIVMHNHPSGDPSPSQADHNLTRRLAEAAELLQIKLLDHVIIGDPTAVTRGYFSFKEAGVL